ncbi:MAG: hypothetical protein ACE14W_10775 [Candidatus Velamenicoccus archaeovorus]
MRFALLLVDAFVALTAIGGGITLAAGLEGDRFPLDWLERTPFDSYVIPGVILAVAVGGSAAAATATTVLAPAAGGWVSVAAGFVLLGQIGGELALLRQPISRTEVLYFGVSATMMTLGLLVAVT